MNLIVRSHSLELADGVEDFVRDTLTSALERFVDELVDADVFLSDVNGPKGGPDKEVLVRLRLRNGQVIMAETVREDLYAALVDSVKKAKRAVRRSLKKSSRFDRRSLRTLPTTLSTEV